MKVLSNYILEKLRISSKNSVRTPKTTVTYLDFYNTINRYCIRNEYKNFVISMIDDNSRPEFLYDDDFEITNIFPNEDSIKKLGFRISCLTEKKYEIRNIEVTGNEDKLVDFITPEWIDKIMEYSEAY